MKLKGRLKTIADMLISCDVLADVGTDHAYIPVFAVKNQICRKAVATDVRKGPIQKAKANISEYGLENFIETRVGYGLEPLLSGELDLVVIAGMGGILIRDILKRDMEKSKSAKTIILQPMNSTEILRSWLYSEGFEISDETLCKDEGRIYVVIKARWTGNRRMMDEIECFIGERLIEKKDPLLGEHIDRKLSQVENILCHLRRADGSKKNADLLDYYERLKSKLNWVKNSIAAKGT